MFPLCRDEIKDGRAASLRGSSVNLPASTPLLPEEGIFHTLVYCRFELLTAHLSPQVFSELLSVPFYLVECEPLDFNAPLILPLPLPSLL